MPNTWDLPTEGCENTMVAPGVPCATHNLCILGIDQRMNRIIQELTRSVSGRVTAMSPDDKGRLDQYYANLMTFITLTGSTFTDFHFLAQFKLTDLLSEAIRTENEAINSSLQYLVGANINMWLVKAPG